MILAIRQFFEKHLGVGDEVSAADVEHRLHLAAAALLVEMARADYEAHETEMQRIADVVRSAFDLDHEESDALLALAEQHATSATSLHGFTSLINEHWTLQKKIDLVELMWQIAYADTRIDKHEHHLMRKMVQLLYIPHADYVAARLRAKQAVLGHG